MKITRTKKNLQEKKLYEGYIVKVEEDEEYGIARLYIELDNYPDEWFLHISDKRSPFPASAV